MQNIIALRPRQNGRHCADDTFKRIFLKENARISITISLKFVPNSPIDNIPALFQIRAWHRPGDKPLSEPMRVSLLTHMCVAWPQWVKISIIGHVTLATISGTTILVPYDISQVIPTRLKIGPNKIPSIILCFAILSVPVDPFATFNPIL